MAENEKPAQPVFQEPPTAAALDDWVGYYEDDIYDNEETDDE